MDNQKLKSGNVLLIVIIIIVILAIAGGTLWYLTSNQKNLERDNLPTGDNGTVSDLLSYSNSNYKISINYPNDWQKQEEAYGTVVAFLSPSEGDTDVFRENVTVLIQDLSSQPMTLEEYTQFSLDQLPQLFPDLQIIDSREAELSNNPAGQMEYTATQGDYLTRILQVWTVKDNKAYVITYVALETGYDKYLDKVQSVIESFSINE